MSPNHGVPRRRLHARIGRLCPLAAVARALWRPRNHRHRLGLRLPPGRRRHRCLRCRRQPRHLRACDCHPDRRSPGLPLCGVGPHHFAAGENVLSDIHPHVASALGNLRTASSCGESAIGSAQAEGGSGVPQFPVVVAGPRSQGRARRRAPRTRSRPTLVAMVCTQVGKPAAF